MAGKKNSGGAGGAKGGVQAKQEEYWSQLSGDGGARAQIPDMPDDVKKVFGSVLTEVIEGRTTSFADAKTLLENLCVKRDVMPEPDALEALATSVTVLLAMGGGSK